MEERISKLKAVAQLVKADTYPRIGHKVLHSGHNLILFGGTNAHTDFNATVLKINKASLQACPIAIKNSLALEGFAIFYFKQQIYFWGGCRPLLVAEETNQLKRFVNQEFSTVEQRGQIPKPRHLFASVFIAHRYLLIYGGISRTECYADWAILDCNTMTWSTVKPSQQIKYYFRPNLLWIASRGYLILNEIFNIEHRQPEYCSLLYEFTIDDYQAGSLTIEPVNVTEGREMTSPRGFPTINYLQLQSPYIILFGGERIADGQKELFSDAWMFNLETLEWREMEGVRLHAKIGMEVVVHHDKILLVGGAVNTKELTQKIDIIDFGNNPVGSKVCGECQKIYGIKTTESTKALNLRYQYTTPERSFFSMEVIEKIVLATRNPLSAFGLLVDNSFNFSSTFFLVNYKQPPSLPPYFLIQDNSYGLNRHEIQDALYSFSYKVETFSHDAKLEEEMIILKEYGMSLKMGALRIGQTCLFVFKTKEADTLVAYFSTHATEEGQRFEMMTYVLNEKGDCNAENNRAVIRRNALRLMGDQSFENLKGCNCRLLITHLRGDLNQANQFQYPWGQTKVFRNLDYYLQSLYLQPYVGRMIKIDHSQLRFFHYGDQLRRDEKAGKIVKVDMSSVVRYFKRINIYRRLTFDYGFEQILIYKQNRLIYSLDFEGQICGYIQIPQDIEVDLCKTHLEKQFEQKQLHTLLLKVVNSNKKADLRNSEEED